ncbi:hypothetical protein Q5H93_19640 [Hymenobacter sp. ASUV-10]|uniref:Uncharacterized protein n=1 Tax=Hymenobacter aranciens TaxID=3063996 RepID=A0ABT9BGZ0_9BACT|nr:hypothetical protein [Hymenobacter sp. ASUV-10]MDO7876969.1 hypothetical protein [Hymenobacter sp. ASUV-10]
MSEKLKHLSQNEIENLIKEYYAGESIAALISRYNIDVLPSQLVKAFPPKILPQVCGYCGGQVVEAYSSKSSRYANPVFCIRCDHKLQGYCNCNGCRQIAHQAAIEQAEQEAAKKQIVAARFAEILEANRPDAVDYDTLTFEQKVYLGAVLRAGISEDYSLLLPFEKMHSSVAPTDSFTNEIIHSLTKEAPILLISPVSHFSSYGQKGDGNFYYHPDKVTWELNLYKDGMNKVPLMDLIMNPSIMEASSDDKFRMWQKNALEEVLQDLTYSVEALLKTDSPAGEKTKTVFSALLRDYSTSQIYGIIYNSINQALRYKAETNIPNKRAANSVVGNAQSYGERALANGWVINKRSRKRELPISAISNFFFGKVLGIGDKGFTEKPTLEMCS